MDVLNIAKQNLKRYKCINKCIKNNIDKFIKKYISKLFVPKRIVHTVDKKQVLLVLVIAMGFEPTTT